ncbi:MAG: cyclopropane-fatty-acyl-phospholipid synthase family protein [Parachlamydiales bacterium]
MSSSTIQRLIEEYPPEYCRLLEAVYGEGMMSEGGPGALFMETPVRGERALDIGAGLGGIACHLADRYGMEVTGLDVNPWMVEEATRRAPPAIRRPTPLCLEHKR